MQSIQVQLQTYKKHKKSKAKLYKLDGTTPSALRNTHNLICVILYAILALIFIGALALGIKQGDIYFKDFLYPTGQGYRCGHGQVQDYPYAYFYNPTVNNLSVCIKQCPTLDKSTNLLKTIDCYFHFACKYSIVLNPDKQYSLIQLRNSKVLGYPTYSTVGNLCLPTSSIITKSLSEGSASLYTRISYQNSKISIIDIFNKYQWIIGGTACAFLLTTIFNFTIRYITTNKLIIFCFGITLIESLTIAIGYYYQAGVIYIPMELYNGYLGLSFYQLQYRYLTVAIIFTLLAAITGITGCLHLYRVTKKFKIPQQDQQIKELHDMSSNIPKFTCSQATIYIIFLILDIAHWYLCIYVYILLFTAHRKDSSLKINHMFTQYFQQPTVLLYAQKALAGFVIFWAIYGSSFIVGCCETVISIFYSKKYQLDFQNRINIQKKKDKNNNKENHSSKKQKKNNEQKQWLVGKILITVIYYHFGSIVLATFFSSSFGRLMEIIYFIFKIDINKLSNFDIPMKMLKIFSPGVYLHIGIEGNTYLKSSENSHYLVWQHPELIQSSRYKNNIQNQNILSYLGKLACIMVFPLIFTYFFSFSKENHATIFQQLWIFVPILLISDGIASIMFAGVTNCYRVRYINIWAINKMRKKRQQNFQQDQEQMIMQKKQNQQIYTHNSEKNTKKRRQLFQKTVEFLQQKQIYQVKNEKQYNKQQDEQSYRNNKEEDSQSQANIVMPAQIKITSKAS